MLKQFLFALSCILLLNCNLFALNLPLSAFPMQNYPQSVDYWLSSNNQTILIDKNLQQIKFKELKSHYYGITDKDQSPWSKYFVSQVLKGTVQKNIYKYQTKTILSFDNSIQELNNIGYGINYLPYTKKWIGDIVHNMNMEQFKSLKYNTSNCAIIVNGTEAYTIPTNDPWYLSYTIAGEGFPFNNNIISSVYLGTPIYVVGVTLDKEWALVITPQFLGWIDARNIAYVKSSFIKKWNNAVGNGLASIIAPHTQLLNRYDIIMQIANSGTLLPLVKKQSNASLLLLPIKTPDGLASATTVKVENNNLTKIPLVASYTNFKLLISKLLGFTYGWGGYLGYNDCSADMQSIFTPFGFFMPRNSLQQAGVGAVIDLSKYSKEERFNYLIKNTIPMITIIYINGHIMLYVGNVEFDSKIVPVVFQNLWGIRNIANNYRYIIGKSVLFPLLLNYPESSDYWSLLDRPTFKLSIMNVDNGYYNMLNIIY